MLKQDKRGISPIIGYVLLIAGVIAVSVVIYPWLKSYVPQEITECKEGASLFVKYVNCTKDLTSGKLELRLTLRNNGLFDLDGFMIYSAEDKEQEIATTSIAQYAGGAEGLIMFNGGRFPLKPNEEANYFFSTTTIPKIEKIEIIPARFEIANNKNRFTICGNSKISETIECEFSNPIR